MANSRWPSRSAAVGRPEQDRKSTRLNSSHLGSSYAVFCLKKKTHHRRPRSGPRGRGCRADLSSPRRASRAAGAVAVLPFSGRARDDRPVHRKVVTVPFCDVVGSTALGASTDPEALQALLARYFERMKATVERHGGTVEKFIGDAVMVFFLMPPRPPRSTLFPYTTLFR